MYIFGLEQLFSLLFILQHTCMENLYFDSSFPHLFLRENETQKHPKNKQHSPPKQDKTKKTKQNPSKTGMRPHIS